MTGAGSRLICAAVLALSLWGAQAVILRGALADPGADLFSLLMSAPVLAAFTFGFVLAPFWGSGRGLAGPGAALMAFAGPIPLGLMGEVIGRHGFAPAWLGVERPGQVIRDLAEVPALTARICREAAQDAPLSLFILLGGVTLAASIARRLELRGRARRRGQLLRLTQQSPFGQAWLQAGPAQSRK